MEVDGTGEGRVVALVAADEADDVAAESGVDEHAEATSASAMSSLMLPVARVTTTYPDL